MGKVKYSIEDVIKLTFLSETASTPHSTIF